MKQVSEVAGLASWTPEQRRKSLVPGSARLGREHRGCDALTHHRSAEHSTRATLWPAGSDMLKVSRLKRACAVDVVPRAPWAAVKPWGRREHVEPWGGAAGEAPLQLEALSRLPRHRTQHLSRGAE